MSGHFDPKAYKMVWFLGFLDFSARLKGDFILGRTAGLTSGLEVGCATGALVDYLDSKGKVVTGVDFSKEMVDFAKTRRRSGRFLLMDAEKLKFKSGSFEFVYCLNVLHHAQNWRRALKEMVRVASRKVLICEPNYQNPLMRFYIKTIARKYDEGCRFIMPEEFPKKFGTPLFTRLGTHYWFILEKKRK